MKYALLVLLIVVNSSSFGQGRNKLKAMNDSLIHKLETSQVDSVKAGIMIQLAENLMYSDPDSAIYYGESALELAERNNLIQVKLGAMGFIGNTYVNNGDLPRALDLGFQAIEMAKDVPIVVAGIGPTIDNMGNIYFEIANYEKAMYYYKEMVKMGDADIVGVAFGYFHMAEIYEKLNLLDSAMIFLDKSRQIFGTLNHSFFPRIYPVTPTWYNLRAKVYLKQHKPELALKDLFTILQLSLQNDQAYYSSTTFTDISRYYKRLNLQDSIIYYAERGLAEASRIGYSRGILHASEILAEIYDSKDPGKALYFYKLAAKNRNKLYGAGNIQIMRDMITQNENKQRELDSARIESRNRIRLNSLLGSLFTLIVVALLLFRNSRVKNRAKKSIEKSYEQLKATQSQLIQSEKMASLGELTAGIAHEIQNPLNFVNNFSEVSEELIIELKEELDNGDIEEAKIISDDVVQNLQKIHHHGQRASGIVKGMLEHSRTGDGKKELTDINALADEYLRLAYHGLRAKDKSFNAEFRSELDETLPKINVIPQDIGRVLLNLINNAFYASSSKAAATEDVSFKPLVEVGTQMIGDKIQITVSDNGPGIPSNIKDKIFQPFFTTKPTGSGTGLGLSLSYDIVKAHGGDIKVESPLASEADKERTGAEFIILLPLN